MTSLYSILGVPADASPEQIDAAYADLIRRIEPGSAAPGHAELQARLAAAREAHAILSDPAARQRYNMKRLYAILGVPADALPAEADAACARLIARLEAESTAAQPPRRDLPAIAGDPIVRPPNARKSLYALLGVDADATPEQINDAYARLVARIQASSEEDKQANLIAAREAYAILSDRPARDRYDIKLRTDLARAEYMPAAPRPAPARQAEPPGGSGVWGFLAILLAAAVALGGLFMYTNSTREKEKLRIEHERDVQMRALQLLEEEQARKTQETTEKQARSAEREAETRAQRERSENERYLRDLDQRHRSELREEESRRQSEAYEAERKAHEAEARQRRELADARWRAERDKAEADRIERERERDRRMRRYY